MEILNVIQGTEEWLELKLDYFSASEAAAMLGLSKHTTRDELLREKAFRERKEEGYSKHLEEGHEAEALTRPVIERLVGENLYPVTAANEIEGLPLLASMDGLTMSGCIGWENKQWNKALAVWLDLYGDLPDSHWPQVEQQLLVCGSNVIFFTTSSGKSDNEFALLEYRSTPERRERVIAGWKLFAEDLASYKGREIKEKPEPDIAPPGLPVLFANVSGALVSSNINSFEEAAHKFLDGINAVLVDDQDFANAEANVKICAKAEKALQDAKASSLQSTADLDRFFSKVDAIGKKLRESRLTLSRLVKEKKESIRLNIVIDVSEKFQAHAREKLAGYTDVRPVIDYAFNPREAMKGRRTVTGLTDAAEHALTQAILDYDRLADAAAIEAREAKRVENERIERAKEEAARLAVEQERQRSAEPEIKEELPHDPPRETIAELADELTLNVEMITITKAEYTELVEAREWANALQAAGVDDWVGFEEASRIFDENRR